MQINIKGITANVAILYMKKQKSTKYLIFRGFHEKFVEPEGFVSPSYRSYIQYFMWGTRKKTRNLTRTSPVCFQLAYKA